jgi:hypothetical protein
MNRLTGRPPIKDNRDKPAAPPITLPDGRLRCPGEHCRGVLSKITPARCPDCLQELDRPPRPKRNIT